MEVHNALSHFCPGHTHTQPPVPALTTTSLQQAPGLAFSLPKEYASLPHLIGRATVELTVEKADDSLAFVDTVNGGLSKQGKVCVVQVGVDVCLYVCVCVGT